MTMNLNFKDTVARAKKGDLRAVNGIHDTCRFKLGMNYNETFEAVRRHWPDLELPEWDQLLAELDDS